jgi:hypothetical protein
MKRVAIALACLAIWTCGTSSTQSNDSRVAIDVRQLSGPADQGFPGGFFKVLLAFELTNQTDEALTLKQLDLDSMGGGGPYRLRKETYYFDETIAPRDSHELQLDVNAFSTGDYKSVDAYAPVQIRGVATFQSASGTTVRKIFLKTLRQE